MKKILVLFLLTFVSLLGFAQSSYYYYNGQPVTVNYSTRILFVHFIPNLSNSQKQSIIAAAALDLYSANSSNIPDYVQLQSRIISGWHWVYPCTEALNLKDSIKADPNFVPLPCEGCPDCTPRWEYYEFNNIENGINNLAANSDVRSVSKEIVATSNSTTAVDMCEEFFIKIKAGFNISDFSTLINTYNLTATDVSAVYGSAVYKIETTNSDSRFCLQRANMFYQTGNCELSHPNFYVQNPWQSDDPLWSSQWGLKNSGQYGGVPGADIRIEQAWQITQGNSAVKIAVMDNGVELTHPDLAANLLPGFDGYGGNTAGGPLDVNNIHGTNVAGVIGAIANNNIGIAGIAPNCKIMPVRVGDYYSFNMAAITAGLNWAVNSGAWIINNSWTGGIPNDLLENAINKAVTIGRNGLGCLVFFSSGNFGNPYLPYPSKLPSVMSVGGVTMCNQRKSLSSCDGVQYWESTYGSTLDFVAPSPYIATLTTAGGTKTDFGGTSASCPHASGIAALMLSVNPNLTLPQARKILNYSCNKVGLYCYDWSISNLAKQEGGWNVEMGFGRLNAYNAVQLARPGVTISNPTYDVVAQANTQVTGNIGIVVGAAGCSLSLPYGVAFVKRYAVTANISFPSTNNPFIISSSNGFSQANPLDGKRWAEAYNITSTSATLRTYVYYGYNSIGQQLGWFPYSPSNIKFTYTVIGSPVAIDYQYLRNNETESPEKTKLNLTTPFSLDYSENITVHDIPFDFIETAISPNPVLNTLLFKTSSPYNYLNIEIVNNLGILVKRFYMQPINKETNTLYIEKRDIKL
jgi:subtilisin family serine protease